MEILDKFIEVPDAQLSLPQFSQLMMSVKGGDQVFESKNHGLFNAGLFGRLLAAHPSEFTKILAPIEPDHVQHIVVEIQINPEVIKTMTARRLLEPVYIVTLDDEAPHLLIDGHHRMVRAYMLGQQHIKAIIASPAMTDLIHVVKAAL